MADEPLHEWNFTRSVGEQGFEPTETKAAIRWMRSALNEIRSSGKDTGTLSGLGAVVLLEHLVPALRRSDMSSHALSAAVSRTVEASIHVVLAARANMEIRRKWLERLFDALQRDFRGYLLQVGERWGELCVSTDVAGQWADRLLPVTRTFSRDGRPDSFRGQPACLSALVAAQRHGEVLDLLSLVEPSSPLHRYGVFALAAAGRIDEAVALAERRRTVGLEFAELELCERLLLDAGRAAEAWQRFGRFATRRTSTYQAQYDAVLKKYPSLDPLAILHDLINDASDQQGRWFATAVRCGHLDLAADIIRRSPADHCTTLQAAKRHIATAPQFAFDVASAALRWMLAGRGFDVFAEDVKVAIDIMRSAGERSERDLDSTLDQVIDVASRPNVVPAIADAAIEYAESLRGHTP